MAPTAFRNRVMNLLHVIPAGLRRRAATALALAAACAGFLPVPAPAQQALGPMVFSVGTSWRQQPSNQDWGYLLWLGNDNRLLIGRTFAVYAKPGDINSPGTYQRVAIIQSQTDPVVIAPLLQRAAAVGDNLATLEATIDEVFQKFVPANATLAEKIAAAIRGAVGDERHFGRLILLARAHPSVAMALGVAHAEPIGAGLTTFELRQFNPATRQDANVVGRVTVEAGNPLTLPAPGQPVVIPQPSAKGDMNVKLRWATPDDLRRVSLLQHGFNVWRVRRDYAESPIRAWHITPPTPDILLNYAQSTSAVRKLTQDSPVLIPKNFSAADVSNFNPVTGDSNTVFYTDADLRGLPGYEPDDFVNGAEFYYFVSARDVLGRDGLISPGRLTKICDRLFPDALTGVEVINDYQFVGGVPKHHLRVIWPQAPNAPGDEETIQRYWVYRWTNVNELRLNLDNPTNGLIGIVNHQAGLEKNSYLDNGPGSPGPAQVNKTYWYTVRAEDSGACGGNLSPHSGPVSGALRDREGPEAGGGRISGNCYDPAVSVIRRATNSTGVATPIYELRVNRIRTSPRIAWMELSVLIREPNTTNLLAAYSPPRHYFANNENTNTWDLDIPGNFSGDDMFVVIRAAHVDGRIDQGIGFQSINWGRDQRLVFDGIGSLTLSKDQDCGRHDPINPSTGGITPIDVTIIPSAGSRELRLYRRVDDGPLTMICQKTWSGTNAAPLVCQDDAFPAATVRICYYVQLFDEHGNGGPLQQLGCTQVSSPEPLPKPMLTKIKSLGSEDNASMTLRWFCPPAGIERFEVGIAGLPTQLGDNPSEGLLVPTGQVEQHVTPLKLGAGKYPQLGLAINDFKIFRTPKIGQGSSFGSGSQFSVNVAITPGVKYVVFVRAKALDGAIGPKSNLERFLWTPTPDPTNVLPTVEWPSRPLPAISNSFPSLFTALWMTNANNNHTGLVITVGQWYREFTNIGNAFYLPRPQVLRNVTAPMSFMNTNEVGDTLFPVTLYRYQVPSARFPQVSGDLIQASPLLETIAFQQTTTNGTPYAVIHDPFVIYDGASFSISDRSISIINTYVKDTQPAIRGARYRYLLVRYRSDGEIAEVIPTNEVEVP